MRQKKSVVIKNLLEKFDCLQKRTQHYMFVGSISLMGNHQVYMNRPSQMACMVTTMHVMCT